MLQIYPALITSVALACGDGVGGYGAVIIISVDITLVAGLGPMGMFIELGECASAVRVVLGVL